MNKNVYLGLDKERKDKIWLVMKGAQVSGHEAFKALRAREWDVECAVEYASRSGLISVMPDEHRYPLWLAKKNPTSP